MYIISQQQKILHSFAIVIMLIFQKVFTVFADKFVPEIMYWHCRKMPQGMCIKSPKNWHKIQQFKRTARSNKKTEVGDIRKGKLIF